MTHYFLDSSALIKRYIPEPGTHWVRTMTTPGSGHTVFIAHLTPIEMVSGLNRRAREGHLSTAHAHAIRQVLDRYADSQYVGIGFNHQIAARAKDLLERHALRAYDVVQLASALEANALLVSSGLSPLIFVCADNRLTAVAAMEGLATDNPNNHP